MAGSDKKFTRNKAAKIEQIIQVMADLIAERGYEGFSINDIPERAGLSIGTVYRYFPKGKAGILQEIMKRNIQAYLKLADFDKVSDTNFRESWRDLIQSYIIMHREDMILGVAMRTASSAGPELARDLQPIIVTFYKTIADRIKHLSFFKGQPEASLLVKLHLAFSLMGYVREMHERVALFPSDTELVEYMLHLVLYTLGVPEE
jgi:AcrR family transcriptional regulator